MDRVDNTVGSLEKIDEKEDADELKIKVKMKELYIKKLTKEYKEVLKENRGLNQRMDLMQRKMETSNDNSLSPIRTSPRKMKELHIESHMENVKKANELLDMLNDVQEKVKTKKKIVRRLDFKNVRNFIKIFNFGSKNDDQKFCVFCVDKRTVCGIQEYESWDRFFLAFKLIFLFFLTILFPPLLVIMARIVVHKKIQSLTSYRFNLKIYMAFVFTSLFYIPGLIYAFIHWLSLMKVVLVKNNKISFD